MSDNKDKDIELDDKTKAVFKRKGYKILERLSAGAFGQVFKAKKRDCNEFVAVKVMDLETCGEKFKEKFLPRELAALIEVKHENVIQIYDIIRSNRKVFIFMEFAGNGDISGYLKKHGALKENLACVWFTQMADALYFIHTSLHIAHRDIKLDNILLNEVKAAKLTDFGFAKECYDREKQKVILSETFCGTEPYYSPQILKKKAYNPFAADVWALGVVLFSMLNNKYPFHFGDKLAMNKEMKDSNHLEKRYVKKFSDSVKDLMKNMFTYEEKERIVLKKVLKHKWVVNKGKDN